MIPKLTDKTFLITTIDTEEDQWGAYDNDNFTGENIKEIVWFQNLCDNFNVRPTYLLTYPIVCDNFAIRLFKELSLARKCEIGAHCHPWNTPPVLEKRTAYNSMLCNLSEELQGLKLATIKNKIAANLDVEPVAFRAGRWGFNSEVALNLRKLGYRIDTSVTPYVSWTDVHGPDFRAAIDQPHFFNSDSPFILQKTEQKRSKLLEVPVSIGYKQMNYKAADRIFRLMSKNPVNKFKLIGILDLLGLLNKIWLSPELHNGKEMISLIRSGLKRGYRYFNMMFHSTSLTGKIGFIDHSREEFGHRISMVYDFCIKAGIKPITLRETLDLISHL